VHCNIETSHSTLKNCMILVKNTIKEENFVQWDLKTIDEQSTTCKFRKLKMPDLDHKEPSKEA
jgi:hypothetical protein